MMKINVGNTLLFIALSIVMSAALGLYFPESKNLNSIVMFTFGFFVGPKLILDKVEEKEEEK